MWTQGSVNGLQIACHGQKALSDFEIKQHDLVLDARTSSCESLCMTVCAKKNIVGIANSRSIFTQLLPNLTQSLQI